MRVKSPYKTSQTLRKSMQPLSSNSQKSRKKKLRPLKPAAGHPPDPKSGVSTTQTLSVNNSINSGPFGMPFDMLIDVVEGNLDTKFEVVLLCRILRNGGVCFCRRRVGCRVRG